jgi:hypothetical protein
MPVKIGIIFSLKAISTGIEHYLMKEMIRKKKQNASIHSTVPDMVVNA